MVLNYSFHIDQISHIKDDNHDTIENKEIMMNADILNQKYIMFWPPCEDGMDRRASRLQRVCWTMVAEFWV